jgi:hypothetical protein
MSEYPRMMYDEWPEYKVVHTPEEAQAYLSKGYTFESWGAREKTIAPEVYIKASEMLASAEEIETESKPAPGTLEAEADKPYCDICDRFFLSARSLRGHLQIHRKKKG